MLTARSLLAGSPTIETGSAIAGAVTSELPSRRASPRPVTALAASLVRLLARIPLPALHVLAGLIAWLAARVFGYQREVVRANLARAFPELSEVERRALSRRYYRGLAQTAVELIKASAIEPAEIRRRVRILNLEKPRALLARGHSVLFVSAHHCNWEWMLLALSLELGYPLDADYRPLSNEWADREMRKLRGRFGARLVPAKELLPDILKRDGVVRAIAMVADQEPVSADRTYWTRFLNQDTAFYMGPEEIARIMRVPAFFIAMRRVRRGFYEMEFLPLPPARQSQPPGALTEGYVRLLEAQIRASPSDWLWSRKRWKLKKSVYLSRDRVPQAANSR